nr:hypothetical protein [Tanacetum cinerariifolium]
MREKEIDTWDGGKGTWRGQERGWVLFLYSGGAQEWLWERSDFGRENWLPDHDGESDGVIASKEFGMIVGCDTEDAIEEGAAKIYNLITRADTEEANTAGLGFNNYIRENELGWDDSAFSVFTTNSEDVKVILVSNLHSPSQMILPPVHPLPVYPHLRMKLRLNPMFGQLSKNPLLFRILPSFSCNSSDKNENTSRTSCNKNGYFNKKAGHFRKHASSVSKLCFVCGSGTHLIKDCDFYEKQIVNKTVGIRVGPVHIRTKVNHQNQFVPQAVLFRTGKVNIPPARPQPVPTGKPKGFAPVPTGRQNRPFPVPTDRGYSPSVISGWWKRIDGKLLLSPQQVVLGNHIEKDNHFPDAEDEGVFDSGCSRSMTGEKVTFGGGEGTITGKGTIRTLTLDFENVYYVKELQQFNLFSISQICDKKNIVLFTNTECLVLSKDFKLPNESMVVLRVPRKHNLYTINLNILCPRGNLACLVVHASVDESGKWHRRMGHVNYKNMNRLLKGNLVRGLPPKLFKNDHTCVACCKGKQHKASYKAINVVSSISEPLFCWVFFLEHKDETYPVLKDFINLVENQLNKKVKAMRCDNVRTACYVLNRVLVTSPYNKTSYALLTGNIPSVSYFKPFGCHVTILNTSDHLGKFDGKADEGYIVGYSASNKAYMVYNVPNKRVEETMNMRFLEEKPNVQGLGQEWYFDLNYLTDTLGYKHVQANQSVGTQEATTNPAGTQDADSDSDCDEQVIIFPSYPSHSIQGTEPKDTSGDEVDDSPLHSADEIFQKELASLKDQEQRATSNAKSLGTGIPVPSGDTRVSTDDVPLHTSSSTDSFFDDEPTTRFDSPSDLGNHDPSPGTFSFLSFDDEFGAALNNVAFTVEVSPVATKRINTIHPQSLIIGDHSSAVQKRSKHIKIRHNFIRDANGKKLIQVLKMHTDDNVVDLLTKAFDRPRSPELGPLAIQAAIDKTPYTITEDLGHPMALLADMISQAQEGEVFEHGPFTNVEDEPLRGSFHMSPPKSTQAPPAGQTSGSAEDLITLTALSSVVSTLVQKVNTLETELKDHMKLFKDVVGKLVKTVKAMEVKLRTTKRKMVMSDSDQEEGGKQDVDLDALLALANASVTVDSNISPGSASDNHAASTSVLADVLIGALNVPTGSTSVPADVPIGVAHAGVSNKGKTLMVEEDIIVKEMTFKQMQEDILAMYYTEADWIYIMARVEANASLSKTLMGDDVSEDNFSAIMADLIKRKKQALAEKLIQAFSRTLKRTGLVIEEPFSKRKKSIEASIPSVPEVPQSPVVSSPKSSDEAPRLWSTLVGWEVIPTPLGDINALYRIDRSTKHFTTLRQILHMVDRQDLVLFNSHEGDVSYPFSVNLMERILRHKLEIDKDVMGNDMTTAEQLIQFIKNQLAAAKFKHADAAFFRVIPLIYANFSSILVKTQSSRYVVPTGRYVVPAGRARESKLNVMFGKEGVKSVVVEFIAMITLEAFYFAFEL